MHPYATHTARWRTIGGLMLTAVVLTVGINTTLETVGQQLGFQAGSISAFAIFGLLYTTFDRFLWRWPLVRQFTSPPNLNGEWVGEINSSYQPEAEDTDDHRTPDGGQPIDGETQMSISQRWSSIEVEVTNPGSSRSESTSATFRTHKSDPELLFTYVNKPIGEAASELSMHEGTNTLRYTQSVDGDDVLEGEYYTDEQRNNHGTMRFNRVE